MAFRYLIYSTGTTYSDTIIRESATNNPSVNEASLFSDFVIPAIQPLYLWRVTGGITVVPNTDQNIENYLDVINPPSPDDPVSYADFTGYTATTQIIINNISGDTAQNTSDIASLSANTVTYTIFNAYTAQTASQISYLSGATDGKLDKITGAINGNIVLFATSGGSVIDSGYSINDILAASGGTPYIEFTGYTASTEIRLLGIEADIQYISGVTSGNTEAIAENAADIAYISGVTDTKLNTNVFTGYTASTEIRLDNIEAVTDIAITGVTNGLTKVGSHDAKLGGNLTEDTTIAGAGRDLSITGLDSFNLAFSGVSTITDSGSNGGLRYGADYAAQYVDRSLVDKAYVDSIAQGLDLKESVKAATTTGETNIDLTGGTFGGVVDGYSLIDGDRVLIKNQDVNKQQNGIYIWDSGLSTFARAIDFVNPNVTSGAFMFVETGSTHAGSGWVLVTQDPISVGTTPLVFTQFSEAGSFTAGVGIDINGNVISFDGAGVAGTNLQWSGTQLNVTGLTSQSDFNSFSALTSSQISYISGVTSGNTADIAALEAAVSGITGGTYVTVQTFTGYTASTNVRITNVETGLTAVSAQTVQNAANIAYISGVTDTKLNTSVFSAYTGNTIANELFLIHTGGTNPNTISPTAIIWHSGITVGNLYQFTGGSIIRFLSGGTYEITYNIPFNISSNVGLGIGGNLILNNVTVIDLSAAAGWATRSGGAGQVALPSINYTFAANDVITLAVFRTGQAGTAVTQLTGSILIKKKNTLQ